MNASGGSALYIETSLSRRLKRNVEKKAVVMKANASDADGKEDQKQPEYGSLEATGHLGDVMKESMRTAYTVAKNVLMKRVPDNEFLEMAHIHVHVPEVCCHILAYHNHYGKIAL